MFVRMLQFTALSRIGRPGPALGPWSETEPPVGVSASKSPRSFIRSYGCGKGLSIAAPCNELPGISGFLVSVHHVNPRSPLMRHLGFNRGSFSCDFPLDGKVVRALGGGSRG